MCQSLLSPATSSLSLNVPSEKKTFTRDQNFSIIFLTKAHQGEVLITLAWALAK